MCADSFVMEDNDLIRHSLNEYILCALAKRIDLANIAGMRKFTQYSSRTNMRPRTWFDLETDAMSDSARIPDFARIFFVFLRGLVAGVNSLNTWGMFLEAVSQAGERASSATDDAGAAATGEAGAAGAPLVPHVS